MDIYLHDLGQNPDVWYKFRHQLGRQSLALALFQEKMQTASHFPM